MRFRFYTTFLLDVAPADRHPEVFVYLTHIRPRPARWVRLYDHVDFSRVGKPIDITIGSNTNETSFPTAATLAFDFYAYQDNEEREHCRMIFGYATLFLQDICSQLENAESTSITLPIEYPADDHFNKGSVIITVHRADIEPFPMAFHGIAHDQLSCELPTVPFSSASKEAYASGLQRMIQRYIANFRPATGMSASHIEAIGCLAEKWSTRYLDFPSFFWALYNPRHISSEKYYSNLVNIALYRYDLTAEEFCNICEKQYAERLMILPDFHRVCNAMMQVLNYYANSVPYQYDMDDRNRLTDQYPQLKQSTDSAAYLNAVLKTRGVSAKQNIRMFDKYSHVRIVHSGDCEDKSAEIITADYEIEHGQWQDPCLRWIQKILVDVFVPFHTLANVSSAGVFDVPKPSAQRHVYDGYTWGAHTFTTLLPRFWVEQELFGSSTVDIPWMRVIFPLVGEGTGYSAAIPVPQNDAAILERRKLHDILERYLPRELYQKALKTLFEMHSSDVIYPDEDYNSFYKQLISGVTHRYVSEGRLEVFFYHKQTQRYGVYFGDAMQRKEFVGLRTARLFSQEEIRVFQHLVELECDIPVLLPPSTPACLPTVRRDRISYTLTFHPDVYQESELRACMESLVQKKLVHSYEIVREPFTHTRWMHTLKVFGNTV